LRLRELSQVIFGGFGTGVVWIQHPIYGVAFLHVLVHEDVSDQAQCSLILEGVVGLWDQTLPFDHVPEAIESGEFMLQAPKVTLGLKDHILWPPIHLAAVDGDYLMILRKVFIEKGNMPEELPLWEVPPGDLHFLIAHLLHVCNHREVALLCLILLLRVGVGLKERADKSGQRVFPRKVVVELCQACLIFGVGFLPQGSQQVLRECPRRCGGHLIISL
jgi:hypothetical protein